MEHLRILKELKSKNYKPVYFLMGEEPYFIDLITDFIEENVLDEASKTFGQTIVYGRDTTMDQVISLAKGFPMMGDKQVVIVKEAQDMKEWKTRKKDDDDENELKVLENYLSNPTPSTLLVFSHKHKAIDKRKKLYKTIEKKAEVFDSVKIKDYRLADWIQSFVTERGYSIDIGAANLLAEYLGTDLSKVVNAVNKLAVLLPAGSKITPQNIEDNIGISKDFNVWELQKALGKKDVMKSNRIIQYFESNPKANPIQMVIPSLYNFFSKLLVYVTIENKNNAAKELGVNPIAINDYKEAAKNYSQDKLERIIGYLRETDKKSKGIDNYSVDHGDLMRELVFKTLH